MVFIYSYLIANDIKHFCVYIGYLYIFFEKYVFGSIAHFFVGLCVLYY